MAASLTLSGVLTGVLVYRLDVQDARDELARGTLTYRPTIQRADCAIPSCKVHVGLDEFVAQVGTRFADLNTGDRLILLGKPQRVLGVQQPARVIYDSGGGGIVGDPLKIGQTTRRVAGETIREGQVGLEGQQWLVAAAVLSGNTHASAIVLARPLAAVSAKALGDLAPLLLWSAAAGLALAIAVTFLVSRALTRPLRELEEAAGDIAAGNYERRVRVAGGDEIGVVGRAFNRMAEGVERSRRLQRDFLANVSHELKTPLTSLIGFSQALMDGSLHTEEERVRAAAILHEESQRVLRMSQELLDLARVESGQLGLDPQPLDLGAQLQQEIEIVRRRAAERGLTLRLEAPVELPPVLADAERLHQILENLLDNAVKYAPAGSQVGVVAAAAGGRLLIDVSNDVGEHAPDPERIFERFYRADPARSSKEGGAGLGLSISRELAVAQDGELSASQEPGGRLRLRLELPSAPRERPPGEAGVRPLRLAPRILPPPPARP